MFRLIASPSASARLGAATRFLHQRPSSAETLIVGASRGAADDLARAIGRQVGATFGLSRFSLTELAARIASAQLAGGRRSPGGFAGSEAVAVRAVFDATAAGELTYFAPVASMPGFPKALARTLHELRLAGISSGDPSPGLWTSGPRQVPGMSGPRPPPFATLVGCWLASRRSSAALRSTIGRRSSGSRRGPVPRVGRAGSASRLYCSMWSLIRDPSSTSSAQLVRRAPEVLATVPDGDERVREGFIRLGAVVQEMSDTAPPESDLVHLRRHVFLSEPPPRRDRAGDVRLFSAPGEGREAIEIVRRVLSRGRTRRAIRRNGGLPALTAAVPRVARARLREGRCAGVLRSRHAASRPCRPRVCGAAVLRRSKGCRRNDSTSTCRSARCRVSMPSRLPTLVRPRDEVFDERGALYRR